MVHDERRMQGYGSLWVLLIMVAVLAAGVISSCGGSGGGGSDGGLCDQCGDDPDGPCLDQIVVTSPTPPAATPVPGDSNLKCTSVDPTTGACIVRLTCRRKVDEGQRRCFPVAPGGADVDYEFRCDGSRPGGTPRPPEPTSTTAPGPTATSVPQTCGNGVREGTEVCDSPDLDGETCETLQCGGGILSCRVTCDGFNFTGCTGIGCVVN